jgi:hypothetical protein
VKKTQVAANDHSKNELPQPKAIPNNDSPAKPAEAAKEVTFAAPTQSVTSPAPEVQVETQAELVTTNQEVPTPVQVAEENKPAKVPIREASPFKSTVRSTLEIGELETKATRSNGKKIVKNINLRQTAVLPFYKSVPGW